VTAIRRLFIANRGEIAVRIIGTCRRLGIETVLACSTVDRDMLPARLADRAICIGPGPSSDSYLRAGTIVQAALGTGCDAIHPGYGFLSENPVLPRLAREHGIVFVGPTAEQIEAVGDKLAARRHAEAAGVPVLPGAAVRDIAGVSQLAAEIGFPVLVKAAGGGGGRGMSRADHAGDLAAMVSLAIAEASAAFGDPRVYLERFVTSGRHVEVQIIGDGEVVLQLGDRDCSVQRRYQKLIEEAPAPDLPDAMRTAMRTAAVRFAGALAYRGVGTVEFLVDVDRDAFYFLEMNARIQVEHPVTEAVTGLDLVALQLAVASGEKLGMIQDDLALSGHAIECRLNAEDVRRDFRPAPGRLSRVELGAGEGIRIDTFIEPGTMIPPYYDSLLAKVIAHGATRGQAIDRLRSALSATTIEGVPTNLAFHLAVLSEPDFIRGGVDTGFLARLMARAPGGP